jgi:GNAT superfamily N-acetyltransferase
MEYVINPLVGGEITKSRLKNQQFDCGGKEGELELAKYIKQFAWKNHELGIAKTFVALSAKDRNILGYYTLSASLIDFPSSIKSELKLPGYPIPVALIGKLAVQKDCKGQGIGRGLMKHAFNWSLD